MKLFIALTSKTVSFTFCLFLHHCYHHTTFSYSHLLSRLLYWYRPTSMFSLCSDIRYFAKSATLPWFRFWVTWRKFSWRNLSLMVLQNINLSIRQSLGIPKFNKATLEFFLYWWLCLFLLIGIAVSSFTASRFHNYFIPWSKCCWAQRGYFCWDTDSWNSEVYCIWWASYLKVAKSMKSFQISLQWLPW